ncbi:hypothetical protein LCGC14_2713040 [marine sediment metagenome]|uniref:Doubled CXXCH motif domain-containing protein n=1 Tax=marine sediment metagenome TaxID=412755 RepID=A0A0F9C470_9ZZZZ|nr:hypothetical protein [Phycisphaerales bacterium]
MNQQVMGFIADSLKGLCVFFNERTILWVAGISCLLFFMSGCDEVEHYEMLAYFFDGVPVPGQEGELASTQRFATDPNAVNDASQKKQQQRTKWYTHVPYETCDISCHGERKQGYSGSVSMPVEPPQLCFQCHEDKDYSSISIPVHGPVAVGECLYCHDPHKSTNEHILRMPAPELCFQCHNPLQIKLIEGHQEFTNCFTCHYGHTSTDKHLLRQGRSRESN